MRFLIPGLLLSLLFPNTLAAQAPSRVSVSALVRQNRLEEAERQLWSVLERQPDQVWALDLMASIRMRQKRTQEAEALFRKATTLDSKDIDGWLGLGEVNTHLGNSTQAFDSFSRVVAIKPDDLNANNALATLYQQSGRFNDSIVAVQRIPASRRPPRLLSVMAADYFALNEPSKVPDLIASLFRMKSDLPAVQDFVEVLLRNGYVDDATHIMKLATPAKPSAEYLRTLAHVRAAQKLFPEAQTLLARALKLQPESFDVLYDSAGLAAQQDRWNDAVRFFRRADLV